MVKEKRILSYFLGWLIVGFIIIFIGVNNVFAASYNVNSFTAQLYDNLGPTLNEKTTSKETDYYYGYTGLTAYSSGGAWGISSPIPLVANHTYSMTVDPFAVGCGFTILSSYPRLGVGTSLANAKTSYQNNTNVDEKFYQAVSNSRYLQYVFTPSINATHIVFPFATTSSCSDNEVQLSSIVIEDLGESSITQDQINTSLTNQTTEIQTSIDNSTNTIIGEIDDMEQSIVDSNKETQDVIKDQFNSCRDSYNLFDGSKINVYFNSSGQFITYSNAVTTNNITASSGEIFTISSSSYSDGLVIASFDSSGTLIERIATKGTYLTYTCPENTSYIIASNVIGLKTNTMLNEGSIAKPYEPYGEEICTNKIDDTNDKLDGIQGALTDSSTPNLDVLENSIGWLPPGPVDSILNLPLTMLNSLTNSLTKTCAPLNLTLPYVNKNIQIPCLSAIFAQITGVNGLWTWVGTIASVLILYNYLLNLYAWVDRVLTLRAEFDEAMGADLANWGRL